MTTVKKRPNVNKIPLSNYIKFRDLVKFDIVGYGGFGMPLPKLGQEEDLYQAMKNVYAHLHGYKKEEIPEHFHLSKHDQVLLIMMYANSGYSINGRIIMCFNKGSHGFDSVLMDTKAIFRAFGLDFKRNRLAEPFNSTHIYPFMCKLLGVTPKPTTAPWQSPRKCS
ncbi:ectonucleotide pyrophosphatase/phosphodiesterase family member 7-like [Pongo abelii]|uniref:ectonucleotide pyrophosphatase/phosphodiesterase family member 7-like n=1 Tax=Pongo abelii TaxID=9601 RepID=UPI0023E7966D|nr:ectonucleotide pyrophosphatase/phosphodiesterase family member 7-like [Pongo abelii]XP_054401954.1 ectonucleotide pyrophosphatase/phosphodiesterase family member 7-like [Pongo abelii]XP_054402155.1 ectonucleotide pyrophosphatase/phosphodiesterase family member 7-like [Pongo abelii]XP_054402156.1 ectonucleotide pyrophosphatase/phosphodiesterase family member 7-like [Pongo abelii]XP_054402158.1 ectonucleotide pyrophosphatase/phosphodiesterase family member 7-like [Pongo abelii]XP_054402159.1 